METVLCTNCGFNVDAAFVWLNSGICQFPSSVLFDLDRASTTELSVDGRIEAIYDFSSHGEIEFCHNCEPVKWLRYSELLGWAALGTRPRSSPWGEGPQQPPSKTKQCKCNRCSGERP